MSCCVKTCKKNKSIDTLFHFPVDEKLQAVWVNILKEHHVVDPDWVLTEDSQICINHFSNSYFVKTGDDVLLTGEAYPTQFEELDDYLIEEIFEDDHDQIMAAPYEEVVTNGDGSNMSTEHIIMEETEEVLNANDLEDEPLTPMKVEPLTPMKVEPLTTIKNNKLKNISGTPKTQFQKSKDPVVITQLSGKSNLPKTVDISRKTGDGDENKNYTIVEGDSGTGTDFKVVADKNLGGSTKGSTNTQNKSMQAIQIGTQYYLVSPNTPDGKELTTSQLSAIKDKIVTELNLSKNKKTPMKQKVKISLDSPSKSVAKSIPTPSVKIPVVGVQPKKNVTTIDLNKGLPTRLKEIMSVKKNNKRKLEDDQETFTVSSSLDIMPVGMAKKSRDDSLVIGTDSRVKTTNFPGSIGLSNMSSVRITSETTPETKESAEQMRVENRTVFYKLLQEVNKNMPALNKGAWSHVYDQNNIAISKTQIIPDHMPRQFLAILIDTRLTVSIYKNQCLLSRSELQDLNISLDQTIKYWHEVKAIIEKLNIIKYTEEQSVSFGITDPNMYDNYINKIVSVCRKIVNSGRIAVQDHDQKIVSFLCEQVSLLNESKEFRKYSINLMVFCYIMHVTSPSVYQNMRKVLLLPDSTVLKELGSADISREFVHMNEHRMVSLASKISGFSVKNKIVVLHMYSIKIANQNTPNVLAFIISSVCKSFNEVVYFCPTQDSVPVNRLFALCSDIIKKLDSIGLQVLAFLATYDELSFELFKRFSSKNEKSASVPHPADRSRKLYLLYENVSILTSVCWDWMSKDHVSFPPISIALKQNAGKANAFPPLKASFTFVANFLKKQKPSVFFKNLNIKTVNLINQVINKDLAQVDENQKAIFATTIFSEKLIHSMELHTNKDYKSTGEFMRIIYNWWNIVNARSDTAVNKDMFKLIVSEKNKDPINKLTTMSKWVNSWRLLDKGGHKLSVPVFHVLGENLSGYKLLTESLLREYNVDKVLLGNFQVSLPANIGFVGSSGMETCRFNFK